MKFAKHNKIFFSSFIIMSLLFSIVQGMKKNHNVMEFLNDLFLEKTDWKNQAKMRLRTENHHRVYNLTKSAESAKKENSAVEGWLKIRSEEFKNKDKFPMININGKNKKLRTDDSNFRINELYDEKKKEEADAPKSETDFYFKLAQNLIYYAASKKDTNIIGSIEIKNLKESNSDLNKEKKDDLCFSLVDSNLMKWDICADQSEIKNKWTCRINVGLGKYKSESECKNNKGEKEKSKEENKSEAPFGINIENRVIEPIIVIPLPSKDCNENWDYTTKGKNWECLCSEGVEQSPIDIPDRSETVDSPITPLFTFEPITAKSKITTLDGELKAHENVKIKFFKNSLRILHSNLGKIVTLDGSVYIGEEIVFHTPAEHKIKGKAFDMEMQVIYYGRSKGDIAKQVVLSFLFEKRPGAYNKFLDDIDFFSLPNAANPERDIIHDLFIPKVFHTTNDDTEIIFRPFSFYTYQGSLTSPPCSEGTIHYVVADPIPLASVPIQLFQEALKANNIEDSDPVENNRTTQPLNGRSVFYFSKQKYSFGDLQGKTSETKTTVKNRVEDFISIEGAEPSGLPGAFVMQ